MYVNSVVSGQRSITDSNVVFLSSVHQRRRRDRTIVFKKRQLSRGGLSTRWLHPGRSCALPTRPVQKLLRFPEPWPSGCGLVSWSSWLLPFTNASICILDSSSASSITQEGLRGMFPVILFKLVLAVALKPLKQVDQWCFSDDLWLFHFHSFSSSGADVGWNARFWKEPLGWEPQSQEPREALQCAKHKLCPSLDEGEHKTEKNKPTILKDCNYTVLSIEITMSVYRYNSYAILIRFTQLPDYLSGILDWHHYLIFFF